MNRIEKYFRKGWEELKDDLKNDKISQVIWLSLTCLFIAVALWHFGHYFEARLGITLTLVEIPIFVFGGLLARRILREAREDAEEAQKIKDKEKHKTDLINLIYKKLADIQIRVRYNKLSLEVDRFDETDHRRYGADIDPDYIWITVDRLPYPYFDYALKHLEEYNSLNNLWNNLINSVEQLNKNIKPEQIDEARNKINEPIIQFRTEMSKLVKELVAGEKLKGECKLGY